MRLWCVECCRPSPPSAKGRRVLRVDVPEEDAESIIAAYCPLCAEREFGASRAALLLHRANARGQRRAGSIAPSVRSKPT